MEMKEELYQNTAQLF